jgi:predicted outer membrane repeat protein
MGYLSWARNRQHRPARRLARYRPCLDVLEGRCVPSTVTNLNDAGPGSLRDAIAVTPAGGTVDFQAGLTGTILLTTGELALAKDLTIAGPGADVITVSGNHASRVFNIAAFTVDISGLTIADGATNADGGGILNAGTLTVTNSTLSGNSASGAGGGILNSAGAALTITNSILSGNSASGGLGGGAIRNDGSAVTITNSTLSGNSAGNGGGIRTEVGTLTVTSSTFSGNSAFLGGGILIAVGSTVTITNSTLSANSGTGGGIFNSGMLTVTNSTLSSNSTGSTGSGGGIYNANPGMITLTTSTLSGNSAFTAGGILNEGGGTVTIASSTLSGNFAIGARPGAEGGGGAIANAGALTITNSTLSGNSAGGFGGGAIYGGGTLTIASSTLSGNFAFGGGFAGGAAGGGIRGTVTHVRNTIIAGNTAPTAPDLAGDLGSQGSQGYNLIGNTQGGSGFDPTDLLNVDPLLGPLQDNGGPTQTMALLAGSPALNAGEPAQLGVADQRGVVRSGGVNIGAYQASAASLVFIGPGTVIAGQPFALTVGAVDPYGRSAVGYHGTVHFAASNGATADYPFTAANQGQHTFSGLVLRRAGTLGITGTDLANPAVTGSTSLTVAPAAADHLLFLQQPTDTAAGRTISPAVLVAVVDAYGNLETGDSSDTVTLSLGVNPGGGTLSGTLTVTVSGGIATFSDLSIDQAGMGYILHATVGGLPDSDSDPFTITGA